MFFNVFGGQLAMLFITNPRGRVWLWLVLAGLLCTRSAQVTFLKAHFGFSLIVIFTLSFFLFVAVVTVYAIVYVCKLQGTQVG